jgi:hypothetical protein
MQTIVWNTCCAIDCDAMTDVYICVDSALTTDGAPFIIGRAEIRTTTCSSTGQPSWYSYNLTYEEGQLIDPPLDPCVIKCVVCDDCLIDLVKYWAGVGPAPFQNPAGSDCIYILPPCPPPFAPGAPFLMVVDSIVDGVVTLAWYEPT